MGKHSKNNNDRPFFGPGDPFPRNYFRNRGYTTTDMRILKSFLFKERFKVQFRSEWLNLSNTPRFAVGSLGNTQGSGNYGRRSATLPGTARNVQFALRLQF